MTRDRLRSASERVRRAAETVDDESLAARLERQADQLSSLSTAERGPDHGRLDRHEHVLRDAASEAGDDAAAALRNALDQLRAYRETVEGV